jgi:hypothetical protein
MPGAAPEASVRTLIARRVGVERNWRPTIRRQKGSSRAAYGAELGAIFDPAGIRNAIVDDFHVDALALELFKHRVSPRTPTDRKNVKGRRYENLRRREMAAARDRHPSAEPGKQFGKNADDRELLRLKNLDERRNSARVAEAAQKRGKAGAFGLELEIPSYAKNAA